MKILMITPYLPYPLLSGGQIRTFNLLKNLSSKHKITLYSFIRNENEKKYIKELKKYCVDVQVFLKRPPWSLTSLFLSALSFYPLVVCMYLKWSMRGMIQKAINEEKFDLIHAETFYVMPNIPKNNIPTILVEQTIEYLVYQHYTHSVKFLPLRWLMQFDVLKIRYWEKKFWQKATHVVAMSQADKTEMGKLVSNLKIDIVPNGVDTSFIKPKSRKIRQNPIILFVGNFKWLQNREAVSILVKNIWPIIQKKLINAQLWIVGRYPTKEILGYKSKSIVISQDIDDIRQAYSKSDVLLAPIYGPGGTRYKILESMAAGLPVVTTSTGIEGLDAVNNRDVIICNSPMELADTTIKILTNNTLYSRLVQNGRKLIEKRFNWKSIASNLDKIYEGAVNEKSN